MNTLLTVTNIGRAIAKTIIRNIFNDPVADITDAFFMNISNDYMRSRETRRYFEEFMDKFSDNLDRIIENSSSRFASDRKEFLLENISIIFQEYDFSLQNLLSKTFNSRAILDDIVSSHLINKKQYSDDEWQQFLALLRLSVMFVVDASSKMKGFSSLTTRETLVRIEGVKSELSKLIDDFEKNRIDLKKRQIVELSSIEMEYKMAIRNLYSKIVLFGAKLTHDTRRYLLEEAYVTLNATDVDEGYSLNVHEFLDNNYLAVFGEAGTGKTTFINWLALGSTVYSESLPQTSWSDKVPFIVELRKIDSKLSFSTIRTIVSDIVPNENTDKWVKEVFSSKRAVLLIDGLDEISNAKRLDIIKWCNAIKEQYFVKIVITSRPCISDHLIDELEDNSFKIITLEPMTEQLVKIFINNWHNAVAKNFNWRQDEVEKYSKRLYAQIRANRSLRSLASFPLLCAMICGLWHNNDMTLPKTRNSLYEECCKMLIVGRDESKNILHEIGNKISEQQKFAILDDIAYWMQINNYTSAKKDTVINRIKNKIQYMSPEIIEIGAEKILDYLTERSGVLRNPSGMDIDFIHKTFQEYLAARVIMKNADYGILIENVFDYNWHETVLLAMGFASKMDADEFIAKLLDKGKSEKQYLYTAVACFGIPTELSPDVRLSVTSIVQLIIPPRNDHEAILLSKAPETIIPYLQYNDNFSLKETKYCINTLLAINTIQALNLLGEYFSKSKEEVRSYILNSIEKLYLQDILDSDLTSVLFSYSFNKKKGVAIITSLIAKLCRHTSYNMTNDWNVVHLKSTDCFECLENAGKINACKWTINENEDRVEILSIFHCSKIEINNLIISADPSTKKISLECLLGFGLIEHITFDKIEDQLLADLYVFSEINGLSKLSFIGGELLYIDSTICEILSYFKENKISLEVTAGEVVVDEYSISELSSINEIIINDISGKHIFNEDNIGDLLYYGYEYDLEDEIENDAYNDEF